MEYVLALATLIVVFIVPAAIVIGIVGAPDRSRRIVTTRTARPTAEPPAGHSA